MASKYLPLTAYLRGRSDAVVELTFADLDRIVEEGFPSSARRQPAWWANSRTAQPHARYWLDAGRQAHPDFNGERVRFTIGGENLRGPNQAAASQPRDGSVLTITGGVDEARKRVDIDANLDTYLNNLGPTARYASFDYCYNHFQSYWEQGQAADLAATKVMEVSCLHLGFYLASWGMLRGSSVLLQRSARHYEPVVETIASASRSAWITDTDGYTDEAIGALLDTARSIRRAFTDPASDILVTKVMLGVFGSVPAFDTYFKKGFGVSALGPKALREVGTFYNDHAEQIDLRRVPTLDFSTGEPTNRLYPRAKIIDMIFFVEGARPQDL